MPDKINEKCCCSNTSCVRHGDCEACMDNHYKIKSKTACGKDGKPREKK